MNDKKPLVKERNPMVLEAMKKHWLLILAFIIASGGCNFSTQAMSATGQNFLVAISKFILGHSNYFFLAIMVLLLTQMAIYIIRFCSDNNAFEDEISKADETQCKAIVEIKEKCKTITDNLSSVKIDLLSHGKDTVMVAKGHKHEIYDCLKDIGTAHRINKNEYHRTHEKIYRIVLNSASNLDEEVKPLIDKYCSRK